MAPEIEFTFLEPIGRRVILTVRETGLLFAFVGAHLGRQFEFVQSQWINDGVFFGAGNAKELSAPTMEEAVSQSHAGPYADDFRASIGLSSLGAVNIASCPDYELCAGLPTSGHRKKS